MSLFDTLPHTITVQTTAYTRDAFGGSTVAYTDTHTSVAAWVQSMNTREITEYQQQAIQVTHKVYMKSNYVTDTKNRIKWTDGNSVDHLLQVRGVRDVSAGAAVLYRVDCEEVSNLPQDDQ